MEQHPHFAALVASDGKTLWDKLPKENARAYATFCQYREMGVNRSIAKLAKVLGRRDTRRLERWSAKWHWRKRVAAYDAEMDRQWRNSKAGEIEQTVKRHKAIAQLMQKVSLSELRALALRIAEADERAKAEDGRPGAREPVIENMSSLRLLAERGTILERLINGDPTEIGETKAENFDPSKLSVEELRELRRLRDKAKKDT